MEAAIAHRQTGGGGADQRQRAGRELTPPNTRPRCWRCWYGGEEAGTAIAETLAGQNNPAGRLPVTFYRSVDQLPPFDDYAMKGRTYRYFKGDRLYGFGFGLSYSKFQYSGLRTQRTATGAQISVSVKNDSSRDGDEVVQLYVSGGGAPTMPSAICVGFSGFICAPARPARWSSC